MKSEELHETKPVFQVMNAKYTCLDREPPEICRGRLYPEMRFATYATLVHGARALWYYVFNESEAGVTVPMYTHLISELKELGIRELMMQQPPASSEIEIFDDYPLDTDAESFPDPNEANLDNGGQLFGPDTLRDLNYVVRKSERSGEDGVYYVIAVNESNTPTGQVNFRVANRLVTQAEVVRLHDDFPNGSTPFQTKTLALTQGYNGFSTIFGPAYHPQFGQVQVDPSVQIIKLTTEPIAGAGFCSGSDGGSHNRDYNAPIYSYMPPESVAGVPLNAFDECQVEPNERYSVRVVGNWQTSGPTAAWPWKDLFEYKTYVNNASVPWIASENRGAFAESSFVTFNVNGDPANPANKGFRVEITAPETINSFVVRPRHAQVTGVAGGNKLWLTVPKPMKLSVEINGDRYQNLHILAHGATEDCAGADLVFPSGITLASEISRTSLNVGRRHNVHETQKHICFQPGAILKGQLLIDQKDSVTVRGHGIIDQSHLPKLYHWGQYPGGAFTYQSGVFAVDSSNVHLSGLLINDPQMDAFKLVRTSHFSLNDLTVLSRATHGKGMDISASSDLTLSDSFFRAAGDPISVNATQVVGWYYESRDTFNIHVDNTTVYADGGYPLHVGQNGNHRASPDKSAPDNLPNSVHNITFTNVDIAEMDQPYGGYSGAMAVHCREMNACSEIPFKHIHVEDFSRGKLFDVTTANTDGMPDGRTIDNVKFWDVSYNHRGTPPLDEWTSSIVGRSSTQMVRGVHFQEVRVSDGINPPIWITSPNQPGPWAGIYVGPNTKNITFTGAP